MNMKVPVRSPSRFVRNTIVALMLLAATLGAGFVVFHMQLNKCHECGRVGQWERIKMPLPIPTTRRAIYEDRLRLCECGSIQLIEKYWGLETGSPTGTPPLRFGTLQQAEKLQRFVMLNGGKKSETKRYIKWVLKDASRYRREDIESLIGSLSKFSVRTNEWSENGVDFLSVSVPITKHYFLSLRYNVTKEKISSSAATAGKRLTSVSLYLLPDGKLLTHFCESGWTNDFK